MSKTFNTIIFDLGGVLIDWNPEYVFLKEFRGNREKMDWFLNTICGWEWNKNQDAGYPIAKATAERIELYPEYKSLIEMYYGRWDEMLGFAHDETLGLLEKLANNPAYRVLALTNWSGETWPRAIAKFPWLQWFEGILVSGNEGMRKPYREIYDLMLSRFDINPENAIFIDDSAENVTGSEMAGITGIHYTNYPTLVTDLEGLGIEF